MFSKFKLDGFTWPEFEEYFETGEDFYRIYREQAKDSLNKFVNAEGSIDGTRLQNEWFPTTFKFDVFLSHSHDDEKLAISLAGYLYKELGIKTFIDSCLWGYSNEMLRLIDEEYCRHSNGTSFDYDKRNYSTSHVHMMLSTALNKMIDRCESVFFLNSNNSISMSQEIKKERTCSPWIFNELSMANIIQVRDLKQYRQGLASFAHHDGGMVMESASLKVEYDVEAILKNFIPLTAEELMVSAKSRNQNRHRFESGLDYIYEQKNLMKPLLIH